MLILLDDDSLPDGCTLESLKCRRMAVAKCIFGKLGSKYQLLSVSQQLILCISGSSMTCWTSKLSFSQVESVIIATGHRFIFFAASFVYWYLFSHGGISVRK
jgi:hypothetical protein